MADNELYALVRDGEVITVGADRAALQSGDDGATIHPVVTAPLPDGHIFTHDGPPEYLVEGETVIRRFPSRPPSNEEATALARQERGRAYPLVGDQLDALWKGLQAYQEREPLPADTAEMLAAIQSVKETYPKPAGA